MANEGRKVFASDSWDDLVNFWKHLLQDPEKLVNTCLEELYPWSKEDHYFHKETYDHNTDFYKACLFLALNRNSFAGVTFLGGHQGDSRYTKSILERIRSFSCSNLFVECLDYKIAIEKHKDKFLYLDPPYIGIKGLYGRSRNLSVDPEELFYFLKDRKGWILSYNNCETVRDLYKDFKQEFPIWSYSMSKDKTSKEILIYNI